MSSLTMHASDEAFSARDEVLSPISARRRQGNRAKVFSTEETDKGHMNSIFNNVASIFGPFRHPSMGKAE
jgi:hypothetical protein